MEDERANKTSNQHFITDEPTQDLAAKSPIVELNQTNETDATTEEFDLQDDVKGIERNFFYVKRH